MSKELIADRYIRAFSQNLPDDSRIDTLEELAIFCDLFSKNGAWVRQTLHPGLSPMEKANIFKGLISKAGGSPQIIHFFKVLAENNRVELLSHLSKSALQMLSHLKNQVQTHFIFATEVSSAVKSTLLKQFEQITKKEVIPTYEIDPEILGGFQVYYDNKVLDGSLLKSIESLSAKTEVA